MFNSYVVISCNFLAGHSNHSRLRPAHPKPSCWARRPMVSAKARFVAHSELKDPNFNSKILIKYQELLSCFLRISTLTHKHDPMSLIVMFGSPPFLLLGVPLSISEKSGGPRAQRKMPRLRKHQDSHNKAGCNSLKETVVPSQVRHNIP